MIATEGRLQARGSFGSARQAAKILAAVGLTALPQRFDDHLTRALAVVVNRSVGRAAVDRVAATMQRCLGDSPPARSWRTLAEQNTLVRTQGYWARARGVHRRGWRAALEVAGLEHVRRALEKGSGAILWRMDFCGSHIPMQAFHQLGIPLVHISRAEHGAPSDDFIGRRLVAPLYRRAEERHLADRVEIGSGGELSYLRVVLDRLRMNGVVSVMGEFPGRVGVIRPVCGIDMAFATGAPSLARASGATLLTGYAHWLAYDRYRVVIEEPIELRSADRAAGQVEAVGVFAARLQRAITAHPESWMRWSGLS